jgi:hypothetical protein
MNDIGSVWNPGAKMSRNGASSNVCIVSSSSVS